MTRHLMLVPATVFAVMMLVACSQQQDAVPEAPAAEPATQDEPAAAAKPETSASSVPVDQIQQMRCGQLDIAFRPAEGSASLEMDGLSIPLTLVEEAGAVRYSGKSGAETVDFMKQGDEAILTIGDTRYPTCRQAKETPDSSSGAEPTSTVDDLSYEASGNEPAWSLEVAPAAMVLVLDAGQRRVKGSPLLRISREGTQQFASRAGDAPMQATVTQEICRDSMSGLPRPDRVEVSLGDEHWSGCGGDPESLLVGAEWRIVEVDGAPVVPGVPANLHFKADGSLVGKASCNSVGGRFSLTGEGLSLTPLATTKMACEEPVMQQEQALLAILSDAPKHDFDAQGRLLIRASSGEQLVAERD